MEDKMKEKIYAAIYAASFERAFYDFYRARWMRSRVGKIPSKETIEGFSEDAKAVADLWLQVNS